MKKVHLSLISTSPSIQPAWLDFPDSIVLRSPSNRNHQRKFGIDSSYAVNAARDRRRQPAFDLWSQVIGVPPQVPNVQRQEHGPVQAGLISVRDAHACFAGVKRPINDDNNGDAMLAYATAPTYYFEYEPDLVTVAKKKPMPEGLLFLTYVKLAKPYVHGEPIPDGVITHWGLVEADTNHNLLPREHEKRFLERLW